MSLDTYVAITKDPDGKYRGRTLTTSQDEPGIEDLLRQRPEFEADGLLEAYQKAEGVRTEYGFTYWGEAEKLLAEGK